MTTPVVEATFTGQTTSNGTNHSVTLPATINRGDLLIMICGSDGNPTMSPPSGWTEIQTEAANGTAVSVAVFAKSAVGNEDGTSVTWTTGASEQTSTVGYRISGWGGTLADIKFGTAATGTSTTPNPPSLNPPDYTTEDFLFIGYGASDSNRTLSSGISGYTGTMQAGSSTGNCSTYAAYLGVNTNTQDPGTYTISASDEWVANTLAILGTKVLFTEDFEGNGTGPSDGDAMSSSNTNWDLFNGTGTRTFASNLKNNGALSGEFETFGTNQALVKDTTNLPGATNGGVAQKQLYFRCYIRTPDDHDIDNRIIVFEESVANGGDDIASIRMRGSDGVLQILDGVSLIASGTHQCDGHTHWHRIEFWIDQESGYFECRLWWAGDKDNPSTGATNYESISGALSSALPIEVWGIGNYSGVNARLYFDDVVLQVGGWVGPASVSAEPTSDPPPLTPNPQLLTQLVR